jgi:DNA-binding IclR family transcriptional regulator
VEFTATEKVLKVLLAFAPINEPMGTLELSELLGIHRSSVSRILITMKKYGFVQQDKKTKRYFLGRSVSDLAKALRTSYKSRLVTLAIPHLMTLRNVIKESVAFEMLSNKGISMAYRIKGLQPVTISFDYGEMAAVNANAAAKAILAFSRKDLVNHVLGTKEKLPRYTSKTITDRRALDEEFKKIRKLGISFDHEEYNDSIHAVAAPVFDEDKSCVAAVSILVPSMRLEVITTEATIRLLKDTAAKISQATQDGALPPRSFDSL